MRLTAFLLAVLRLAVLRFTAFLLAVLRLAALRLGAALRFATRLRLGAALRFAVFFFTAILLSRFRGSSFFCPSQMNSLLSLQI